MWSNTFEHLVKKVKKVQKDAEKKTKSEGTQKIMRDSRSQRPQRCLLSIVTHCEKGERHWINTFQVLMKNLKKSQKDVEIGKMPFSRHG